VSPPQRRAVSNSSDGLLVHKYRLLRREGMTLFTPQEKRVLFFLIAAVLTGTAIRMYKSRNTCFAPSLSGTPIEEGANVGRSAREESLTQGVDLNRASREELELLPGIGPAYAERIVAYREEHGPFKRKEDLMRVKGIGKKRFKDLEPYITLE